MRDGDIFVMLFDIDDCKTRRVPWCFERSAEFFVEHVLYKLVVTVLVRSEGLCASMGLGVLWL